MSRRRGRRPQRPKRFEHQPRVSKCPHPLKLSFTSQEHAEQTLRFWNYENAPYRPQRAYLCGGCGAWHLTSKGLA